VRRPRSPAALAIRTDPRDVVEERLDDPPLSLDRFLIGEEDAIADERRVEELFVPVPAAWSVTTIAIVRLPVSSSCLLTDRSRPRRRLTDANEHASPSPSATAHERTERLWSQAGATGGNQWQMGAPENRSNKPIRNPWQPTATVSQRMVKSMFATACRRLPTIPYLLERESTSWLCKERSSPADRGKDLFDAHSFRYCLKQHSSRVPQEPVRGLEHDRGD
jgi:hypothetical protein